MPTATRPKYHREWFTFACYGRVYRVEKAGCNGMYWAVGRARGMRVSYLDRLGPRHTREAMQDALNAWALRRGLQPLLGKGQK